MMQQQIHFDGPVYDPAKDQKRLSTQHFYVKWLMGDGKWRTLDEISVCLEMQYGGKFPPASVSAQLRHLRKPRFGSYIVEKRRRRDAGLWEYRLRE